MNTRRPLARFTRAWMTAIPDIQANINKGALIEQSSLQNFRCLLRRRRRIAELKRSTAEDCATLESGIDPSQKPRILALQQGLKEYWSSIQQSLGASPAAHAA